MSENGSTVVIGGTSGLGRAVAEHYAAGGRKVVISGRDEIPHRECRGRDR